MSYLRYLHACLRRVVFNTYVVVFLFCFPSSMLPVSLECSFLIVSPIFSNVHLVKYYKSLISDTQCK
jgi:hypothetical protein